MSAMSINDRVFKSREGGTELNNRAMVEPTVRTEVWFFWNHQNSDNFPNIDKN